MATTSARANVTKKSNTDTDFLLLVATRSLQDVQDVTVKRKGKCKANTRSSDEELAFQLYAEEANTLLALANDAIFARSIDDALRTDREEIRRMVAEEGVAFRDRQFALTLARGQNAPEPSTTVRLARSTTSNVSGSTNAFGAAVSSTSSLVSIPERDSKVELPYVAMLSIL